MTSRLALVGMIASGHGPWLRSTGKEIKVRITDLNPGELVRLHRREGDPIDYTSSGEYPLDSSLSSAFSFEKLCTLAGAPTIVEVCSSH